MKSMILVRVIQAGLCDIPLRWGRIEKVCREIDSYSWAEFLILVIGVLLLAIYMTVLFTITLMDFSTGAVLSGAAVWALVWVVQSGLK